MYGAGPQRRLAASLLADINFSLVILDGKAQIRLRANHLHRVATRPDEGEVRRCKGVERPKQLVAALLTRYGYIRDERTPTERPRKAWGAGYIEWARRAEIERPVTRATLDR